MRQRIRLTESQLHNIIRKCVNEAVNEGQGWTKFKDSTKRLWNGEFDDQLDSIGSEQWNKDVNDYVNGGDVYTSYKNYDDEGNWVGDWKPGSKKANRGISGRIGRWAATQGINGMARTRNMYNKMRGKY